MRRTTTYDVELVVSPRAWVFVTFTTEMRQVLDYSVVLLLEEAGAVHTVRIYDGAHGVNEMHRCTRRGGKQPAEIVHSGDLGAGMRAAIDNIEEAYGAMIEGWRSQ